MIGYTIDKERRQARTEWAELTLGEYLAIAGSDSTTEALCLLSRLSPQELDLPEALPLVEACSKLLESEPYGIRPEWLMQNLGKEGVGRLELCRQYLSEHGGQPESQEQPEGAYPLLYAVYRWPEEYDALYALSGAGMPLQLVERAKAVGLVEALGVVFHILAEMKRLDERYGPLLQKELTEEQYTAGIERFEKYGFFATIRSLAGDSLPEAYRWLEMPADVFYTTLCLDTEKVDYEEKYRKILSEQK